MTSGFNQVLESMAQADFFTGILPFLISYVIFFTLLTKMPFWPSDSGDSSNVDKNKFSAIISVALSLYVSYFLVNNPVYQSFFAGYFGRIVIIILGIIGVMMVLAITGTNMGWASSRILVLFGLIGVISAFTLSDGLLAFLPGETIPGVNVDFTQVNQLLFETGLIWVLVVGGAIWWVTKDSSSDNEWGEKARYWFHPIGSPVPRDESDEPGG